ncbi:MAG: peptidylprolyl isomerase [Mycobacterium leprae]
MSNSNKATTTVLAVVVTLLVAGAGGYMAGARLNQPQSAAVATVNGTKITEKQLYDRMVDANGKSTLQQLIDETLVDQAATAAKVTVPQSEVDAQINKIKAQIGGEDQFQQALQANNITLKQLQDNVLMQQKVTHILGKDIKVDDATLQKYFQDNIEQFDQRQVHARHILVDTKEAALAIRDQLVKGADFAQLAKDKSTEPAAKTSGGDLGYFGHGKMDADFEKAAFALKVNEISQPVQTQYGWHIIQVLDVKGNPPTYDNSKDAVKEAYVSDQVQGQYQGWIQEQRDKAKIDNKIDPSANSPAPASTGTTPAPATTPGK